MRGETRGQPLRRPKEAGPSTPNGPPIYAHAVWSIATEFSRITHLGKDMFYDQTHASIWRGRTISAPKFLESLTLTYANMVQPNFEGDHHAPILMEGPHGGKSHHTPILMEGPHRGQNVWDPTKYAHTVWPRKILMPMRDLSMVANLINFISHMSKTIHFGTWNFREFFGLRRGILQIQNGNSQRSCSTCFTMLLRTFDVLNTRFNTRCQIVKWWRHCCIAHSWYSLLSPRQQTVVNIVYYIGNVSLTKMTNACLHNFSGK